MEYFLQLFGDKTIGWLVAIIAMIIFLAACYKKVEEYFSTKAIREKEKDEQLKEAMEQIKQYPAWHQQSIDIQGQFNDTFEKLNGKMDEVNKTVNELRIENSETKATTYRYRILRFDDEIRHGTKHSKEHFDQIIEDIDEYEEYCDKHPDYKNNKAVLAIENIKRVYQNCVEEHTFL